MNVNPKLRALVEEIHTNPEKFNCLVGPGYRTPREAVLDEIYEEISLVEGEGDNYVDPMKRAERLLEIIEARVLGKQGDKVIWLNPEPLV